MHRHTTTLANGCAALILLLSATVGADAASPALGRPAPAFTHRDAADWLNSKPLTLAGLRGSVVLVDFWAFECWNCYRSFAWLDTIEQRYGEQGLTVIGVHTPELASEYRRDLLQGKIAEYRLRNPVMIDNDHSYWQALGNQYWPAFYLIDRHGIVRGAFVGETHEHDANARQMQAAIEQLLAEQ
ncbi:redoxin family protein [Solimonas terrae]|uniref:Redoxin family protein n=1 Tax=Solimonas terrae TaxID=1396819 RepID=A0A6M2BVW1_9GAMM|nr:redoxin family protein [Solimonas terrae]NGY06097.1 redoxin family protein [Solimonas terrae]